MPIDTIQLARLPFRLPEWAPRVTWVSPRAREVWEGRIQAISQAWQGDGVEVESVRRGIRRIALVTYPDTRVTRNQLCELHIARVPLSDGYTSASVPLRAGQAQATRCAVAADGKDAWAFKKAYDEGDNRAQADLLGYPSCCTEFFERVWMKERWMDPMWRYATSIPIDPVQTDAQGNSTAMLHDKAGTIVNMLWRYLGLRPVFHLPCTPRCSRSKEIASALLALFPDREREWMQEILSWPVEWTALHGIGEIRTPILRANFATDATAHKLTIMYLGTGYPKEGATGTKFPLRSFDDAVEMTFYKPTEKQKEFFEAKKVEFPRVPWKGKGFTFDSKGSGRVTTPYTAQYDELSTLTPEQVKFLEDRKMKPSDLAIPRKPYGYHLGDPKLNGFQSREVMNAAHTVLVDFIHALPSTVTLNTVLDLGCGDGTLLAKIGAKRRYGVEYDEARARAMVAGIDHITISRIDVFLSRYTHIIGTGGRPADLTLIALERLEEQPTLIPLLVGYRLLVYSYAPDEFAARCCKVFGEDRRGTKDHRLNDACSFILFDPLQ